MSTFSGLLTDRNSKESFGSLYALSLNKYLRNNRREGPLRNNKASFLSSSIATPRTKPIDRMHLFRIPHETRKPGGEKTVKYASSISSSTYSTHSTASSFNRSYRTDPLSSAMKYSNHVGRSLLSSRDSSDSKLRGREIRPSNLGLKTSRSDSYRTDFGTWDSKRLPSQLVSTLEEALAGVNQSGFAHLEAKKFSRNNASTLDASLERKHGKLFEPKPTTQMDKAKLQDEKLGQDQISANELITSQRFSCLLFALEIWLNAFIFARRNSQQRV